MRRNRKILAIKSRGKTTYLLSILEEETFPSFERIESALLRFIPPLFICVSCFFGLLRLCGIKISTETSAPFRFPFERKNFAVQYYRVTESKWDALPLRKYVFSFLSSDSSSYNLRSPLLFRPRHRVPEFFSFHTLFFVFANLSNARENCVAWMHG